MRSKEKIVLVGGGGHCRSVIDVIECEDRFDIAGIVDKEELLGESILGYKVIATDLDLKKLISEYKNFMITIGQVKANIRRVELFSLVKGWGGIFPSIQSPKAYVSNRAFIDEGTVIMHRALVNVNASVGKNSIINTGAVIEHDSSIGDHCHIATGVYVNGDCQVQDHCFVGSKAVIIQGITLGNNSVVAAGAVIVSNVEPGSVYAGNPAVVKHKKNA
jgi:sugar O-acyltransferase (sialic acid O-acetyltransferase NeuD family)